MDESIFPDCYGEPDRAWRVWLVVVDQLGRPRLRSIAYWTTWPHRRAFIAECRAGLDPGPGWRSLVGLHFAPSLASECACGIYALKDPVEAAQYLERHCPDGPHYRLLGQVALWGRVLEAERGFRASHAYPERLFIPRQIASELNGAHRTLALAEAERMAVLLRGAYGVPVSIIPGGSGLDAGLQIQGTSGQAALPPRQETSAGAQSTSSAVAPGCIARHGLQVEVKLPSSLILTDGVAACGNPARPNESSLERATRGPV